MTSLSARGVALVLAVFVSGMAVGALGFRAALHGGHRGQHARGGMLDAHEGGGPEHGILRAIDHHVGLGDDQRGRIEGILRDTHRERRSLLRPIDPELEALRTRTQARIRRELRPEQWPAFDSFCARQAERHRRGMRPGPPGPPGAPEDAPPNHDPPEP